MKIINDVNNLTFSTKVTEGMIRPEVVKSDPIIIPSTRLTTDEFIKLAKVGKIKVIAKLFKMDHAYDHEHAKMIECYIMPYEGVNSGFDYKVNLVHNEPEYPQRDIYTSDLVSLINEGHFQSIIRDGEYGCKAYDVIELSNTDFPDTTCFNCDGEFFIYDKEIGNIATRVEGNKIEEIKLGEYKNKIFFHGVWYRGGRKCRECKNRICGLGDDYFNSEL